MIETEFETVSYKYRKVSQKMLCLHFFCEFTIKFHQISAQKKPISCELDIFVYLCTAKYDNGY